MASLTETKDGGMKPASSGLADELKRFRASTIQRDYTFIASFLDIDLSDIVQPQQIVAVGIPQWQFTKDAVYKNMYPVAYPKYDSDGWEARVSIREDAFGSARTLTDALVSRIRRPDGLFNPPNQAKILGLQIKLLDLSGNITDVYQLRNMMYLSSEEIALNHNGSDIILRDLQFHVEDVLRVGNV